MAGIVSQASVYPLDMVKTRLMTAPQGVDAAMDPKPGHIILLVFQMRKAVKKPKICTH
jgi:hypothetical protein